MPTHPESPLTNTNWLSIGKNNELFLAIHAQPAAKRTAIVGIYSDKLKVCLASPPVDGKANTVLIKFFAKLLHIPKSSIELTRGDTSREKSLAIYGLSSQDLLERLHKYLSSN